MSLIQKNIFKLFEQFDNNKNLVSEIFVTPNESAYPNLKFAGRTKQDQINKALLDDLQKASEMTGLDITVDFAKTGHKKFAKSGNVSRHWSQQAVDIDYIGGKVVSPKNKDVVDRYVDALVSMGYTKNNESGNPKAVLTFGFPGHDNHIHVSNKLESSSSVDPDYVPSSDGESSDSDSTTKSGDFGTINSTDTTTTTQNKKVDKGDPLLYKAAMELGSALRLREDFGKNIQKGIGTISIPGSDNPKIKSPIDGKINNSRYVSSCKNQIVIESSEEPKFYLQYCGITKPKVSDGQTVSEGQVIGLMDKNDIVEVLLLDSSYRRKNIETNDTKFNKPPKNKGEEEREKSDQRTYWDPALASLILAPKKIFGNVYDKETGELKTKKWSNFGSKRQVDPWVIDAIKKPFKKKEKQEEEEKKIKENIQRIKGLL